MSITDYSNMAGAANLGALGQYASTTTTSTAYPPTAGLGSIMGGQVIYPSYAPPPTFPNDPVTGGLVGIYRVRRLENGYLVESAPYAGGPVKEHYCESLKDVGERIAALGVQKALEGGPT